MLSFWAMGASAQHALPRDPSATVPPDRLHAMIAGHDRALILEGAFDFNANSLLNELPVALWRGAYLDRELRGRSRDALRVRNSAGYLIDARITYTGPVQERWRPEVSVAHHEHMGVRFPADLFNITFFGNAGYEERRADLGPARFTRMRYQTIGVGVRHARQSHYARIDLVMGESHTAADIRWADLYTGADGRVLRANVNGRYQRSDSIEAAPGSLQGLGLALSGRWQLPLSRPHRGLLIELEAQDFGFCSWGRTGQRLERDTALVFEGITVENILELDQAVLGEDQVLDTLGIRFRASAYSTWLPFRLSARMRGRLSERWKGSITVDQRNLPGYVPQVAFAAERMLGAGSDAGLTLSMGGFGGLRLGASATHVIKERWLITMATPHLPAFFTQRTRGAGVCFQMAYAF